MGDEIRVLDDFLPPAIYANLSQLLANTRMVYGARSNSRNDPHGHWSREFISAGIHNLADVAYFLEKKAELDPLNVAWNFLKITQLKKSVLIRCYLNGYTYGTDGYFHADSTRTDEHTTILFMNDDWNADWAGETVFLGSSGDIVKAVLPKRNRAIIFPAQLRHAARGVSRKCTVLRQAMIFKTRKRRSRNFERLSRFLLRNGAMSIHHTKGTLHDHLVRSFALLESQGFEDAVSFGAGLHAIYGTTLFEQRLIPAGARGRIAKEFGTGVEELVNLFSIIDRPRTLESPIELEQASAVVELRNGQNLTLPRAAFDNLRIMECANLYDENVLVQRSALTQWWHQCMGRRHSGSDVG